MKRIFLTILALFAITVRSADVSTLTIAVNITGSLTPDDKRALQYIIGQANIPIYATNGTVFPTNNNVVLKTSYEQVLSNIVQSAHASYMSQASSTAAAKALINDDAVSASITKAIIDAIVAGKTIPKLLTDITAP